MRWSTLLGLAVVALLIAAPLGLPVFAMTLLTESALATAASPAPTLVPRGSGSNSRDASVAATMRPPPVRMRRFAADHRNPEHAATTIAIRTT